MFTIILFFHFSHYRSNKINIGCTQPPQVLVKLFSFYHSQYKTRLNSAFRDLFSQQKEPFLVEVTNRYFFVTI